MVSCLRLKFGDVAISDITHMYNIEIIDIYCFVFPDFPWLGLPALILLSISGFLILLTDLQIANLFDARRYTVMSVLVGAYYSGGFLLFLMKVNVDGKKNSKGTIAMFERLCFQHICEAIP